MTNYKYILIHGEMQRYEDVVKQFESMDEDFRNKHDNDFDTYLSNMKFLKIVDIVRPSAYPALENINIKLDDGISIEDFDIAIADEYGLWNYCVSDAINIVENDMNAIAVKFTNGVIRLVETEIW